MDGEVRWYIVDTVDLCLKSFTINSFLTTYNPSSPQFDTKCDFLVTSLGIQDIIVEQVHEKSRV